MRGGQRRACLQYHKFLEKYMLIWRSLESLSAKQMATQSVVDGAEDLIRSRRYTRGNAPP